MDEKAIIFTAGTLDGSIFSLSLSPEKDFKTPTSFKALLVDPNAHASSVKSLSVFHDFVISGSSDDIIQMYSISLRQNIGCIETENGIVNSLKWAEIVEDSVYHFISGSEDGSVSIWKFLLNTETAEIAIENVRTMKRHTERVRSVSIHPSNKVCLSISDDKTLRVWDLMHGRQSYVSNIKNSIQKPSEINFSPTGLFYLVSWEKYFHLVRVKDGNLMSELEFEKTFTAMPTILYEDDKRIFIVLSTGKECRLLLCQFGKKNVIDCGSLTMTGKRVKTLHSLEFPDDSLSRILLLSTTDAEASYIRAYRVNLNHIITDEDCNQEAFSKSVTLIGSYDLYNARVTTACAYWHSNSFCPLLADDGIEK